MPVQPEQNNTIDTNPKPTQSDKQSSGSDTEKPQVKPPKNSKLKNLVASFKALDKNKKIVIISALAGVLIAVSGLVWWFVLKPKPAPPEPVVVQKEEDPPAPTTVASRLTGVQVKPELNELPSTAVMIENSPDARPQSGLQQAGVVFEAIAEGGITRFLAIYQESSPAHIGPVRSVRPYYLDFLAPFDAPIAHAGGSAEALAQLRSQNFKDLEAFQNPNYYQRVTNRYAPHNLYTSRPKLLELQKAKKWNKSKYTGFVRKNEEKPEGKPTAKTINFAISSFNYNPSFSYDAKANSYPRSLAGKPHSDEKTGKRISPKVVIAIVSSHRYAGIYSVYKITGSGTAYIFQDGKVTKGIWEKKNRKSQFKFGDKNGAPLGINPGQTWISLVGSEGAVTYKP